MFNKTVVTVLKLDPATGLATAIVSSEAQDVVKGTLSGITSLVSKDTVVTGAGRTLSAALSHYAAMQLTRNKLVGGFALNPLAA